MISTNIGMNRLINVPERLAKDSLFWDPTMQTCWDIIKEEYPEAKTPNDRNIKLKNGVISFHVTETNGTKHLFELWGNPGLQWFEEVNWGEGPPE